MQNLREELSATLGSLIKLPEHEECKYHLSHSNSQAHHVTNRSWGLCRARVLARTEILNEQESAAARSADVTDATLTYFERQLPTWWAISAGQRVPCRVKTSWDE